MDRIQEQTLKRCATLAIALVGVLALDSAILPIDLGLEGSGHDLGIPRIL